MTEEMQGLLAEVKKNRYSTIKDTLSEDDVASVWENVSTFIEKQMALQKGVTIHGLGTFTFTQKKLDIGNNKFILIQRPIFMVSERFAQTHGLLHTKYHVPGQIPVVQLNYAALSFESPFDRDTVESCVKELLGAVSRAIGGKRNVELTFSGIGRLSIRELKVKMKFFKEFINQMDGSGKLVDSLQNRPGTVDSVISERSPSRPGTSATVILPKISSSHINLSGGLAPVAENEEDNQEHQEPPIAPNIDWPEANVDDTEPNVQTLQVLHKNSDTEDDILDPTTDAAITNIENIGDGPMANVPRDIIPGVNIPQMLEMDTDPKKSLISMSRSGSRMAMPMATATGVSILDDLVPKSLNAVPKSAPSPLARSMNTPLRDITDSPLLKPKPPSPKLAPLHRSVSLDQLKPIDEKESVMSPPGTACGHSNAGQELCYLCHQRTRRNIPVSFTEERKKRQEIEDRLLQQFQYMKDAEETLKEQENTLAKRYDLQKMAAFNLGVSEVVNSKKKSRPTGFQKSYIFQKRPLTPPKFKKQDEYSRELHSQVESKEDMRMKRKSDEEFLERLEQVQLAEDLAAQREMYLKEKAEQQDMYKRALESQICLCDLYRKPDGLLRTPLKMPLLKPDKSGSSIAASLCPREKDRVRLIASSHSSLLSMPSKIIRPFSESLNPKMNEKIQPLLGRLKFKPLPMPSHEPDTEVFGRNDMTNEKMADRRQQAYELFQEQQELVAQRKRENILKRLKEQREEEEILERTKQELHEDRANRFSRRVNGRKRLEYDWSNAADLKRTKEMEARLAAMSPGLLLHGQCDKYSRCKQCKRMLRNCGESNIWSESRYIPGSRLMV